MCFQLKRPQRVVEFITAMHAEGFLPVTGMRVERIAKLVVSTISVGIGPSRRSQERQPQYISFCVISVLRLVDQGEAVIRIAKVRPTQGRNFEFCFLPTIVSCGWTLYRPVGAFVGALGA